MGPRVDALRGPGSGGPAFPAPRLGAPAPLPESSGSGGCALMLRRRVPQNEKSPVALWGSFFHGKGDLPGGTEQDGNR